MKTFLPSFALTVTVAALVAGCQSSSYSGGNSAPMAASKGKIDTSSLVAAYATGSTDQLALVNAVVTAVNGGGYKAALGSLQQLARIPGLTAAQDQAVKDLVTVLAAK